MFKIATDPTFTHTVDVLVPVDGGHDKQSFRVTFAVLTVEQEAKFDLETGAGSDAFLRAIVRSMDDLVDGQDQPVPYSDAIRDQLLALPYIRKTLTRSYYDAVRKAPAGN